MPTIYSSDLKLSIMATGENAGTWGSITNTNLFLLQQAIGGYQEVNIAGGAQTTDLVMSDGAISNARNAVIKLTGTITGNQVVTVPTGIEKTYIVENGTSGAFTVEFKQDGGTGTIFSTTDKGIKFLYANGTNIVDVNANLSGPTLASDLNVNGKSIVSTSNGNIVLAPNGSGDVQLDADTVRIGDSNADAVLTTNGTGDITISTNAGSNSGTIKIFDAANGNIEITPNGTGVVKLDGLSYPTADGSANQALVTNGSGVLSFAAISSGTYSVHAISRYNYQTAVSNSTVSNYIDIAGGNYVSFTPTSTNDIIYLAHHCSITQPTSATGVDTYLMMGTSSSITSGDTKLNYDGQNMFYIAATDMYHFITKTFLLPCTNLTPSTTYYIEQAAAQHNANSVTWNYTSASGSGDFKNHNVSLIHYKFN